MARGAELVRRRLPLHQGGRRLAHGVWPESLALGRPLPTLPLWLADNLAVPLELEASYEETCKVLLIP